MKTTHARSDLYSHSMLIAVAALPAVHACATTCNAAVMISLKHLLWKHHIIIDVNVQACRKCHCGSVPS